MSWNKNSAKVIGITAAAAMALSLAPATAFTAYAAPRNGSSVSEQDLVTSKQNFENGSVDAGIVNGKTVNLLQGAGIATPHFEVTGTQELNAFRPSEVIAQDGSKIDIKWNMPYGEGFDADGTAYRVGDIQPGTNGFWNMTLQRMSDNAKLKINIAVVNNSLKNAVAVPANHIYDGSPFQPAFSLNGVELTAGQDYQSPVPLYISGSNKQIGVTGNPATTQDAREYVAVLHGLNKYAGSVAYVHFTVSALDLSKANISIADTKATIPSLNDLKINGKSINSTVQNQIVPLDSSIVSGPSSSIAYGINGKYTVKISAKNSQQGVDGSNVTDVVNSQNASFYKVSKLINDSADGASIKYNNAPLNDLTINLDNASTRFDESKLAVTDSDNKAIAHTVSVLKKDPTTGNYVASSIDAMNTSAGDYQLIVSATPSAPDYTWGGSVVVNVTTKHVNANPTAYIYINNKLANSGYSFTQPYDGNSIVPRVVVKNGDQTLTQGTDYDVEYDLSGVGKVNEIKQAGDYTVSILMKNGYSPLTPHYFVYVHITPIDVTPSLDEKSVLNKKPVQTGVDSLGNPTYKHVDQYAYTGNAINPKFIFKNGNKIVDVPSTAYTISFRRIEDENGNPVNEDVPDISKIGEYEIHIADALHNPLPTDSFNVATTTIQVFVTNIRQFRDVPNTSWFAPFVYKAKVARLMNGYGNSNLFGPYNKLTRAEAAVILSNWAHTDLSVSDETIMQNLGNRGYNTSFKDVKPSTAQSGQIAWATKVGLMTGDPKTKLFRPNDHLTRQEFATIVNRFAKASQKHDGDYKAASFSALDSYSDENKVAPWARQGVAWTVANGVMGKGTHNKINPNDSIIRAEVAAMIVRADDVINK